MELFVNAVEHAVDEAARLLRPELLGDLDGLVDGDLWRHVLGPQELVEGQPEDVAVDHGHSLEVPVLGELRDDLVDLSLVRLGAAHEGVAEHAGLFVDRVARPELGLVLGGIVLAVQVELVQELKRDFARFPAAAHFSEVLWSGVLETALDRGWRELGARGPDSPVLPQQIDAWDSLPFLRRSGCSGPIRPSGAPPRRPPRHDCRPHRPRAPTPAPR